MSVKPGTRALRLHMGCGEQLTARMAAPSQTERRVQSAAPARTSQPPCGKDKR